jgi:diguanylate cyclase (GGDEF)-like protein
MESVHPATLQLCLLLIYLVCGAAVWLLRGRFSRNGVYDRWIGAHLAGALLYLVLLCSPYLTSRQSAMLACGLIISKGCLMLGSFARLLQSPIPPHALRGNGSLLLIAVLALLQWLPSHAYAEQMALALALGALYAASLAWLLLSQAERPFPLKLAGGLCGAAAVYLLLHVLYVAAGDPNMVLYGISTPVLLLVLVATPLLSLCFMAIDKEQELAKLHQLATLDPLTGVFNRRSFEELARKTCAQHARLQRPLALLVMDLDHFKRINDTYGHSRGDMALKALAELVTEHVRAADIFGRFGGEEFCLLLPDTADDGAREVAGKLCQRINTILLDPHDAGSALSASIGVASLVPDGAADWQSLFELADSRLYRAKSAGRNQLVWAG